MPRNDRKTWLTNLFNKIWRTNKMPNDRGKINLVPICSRTKEISKIALIIEE